MGIANTIQAIPSMALLGFLIPFLRYWSYAIYLYGSTLLFTTYYKKYLYKY